MVKFSKQFEAQLVPEWKDAFFDYEQLKRELKKIQFLNSTNNNYSKQQKKGYFGCSFISSLGKFSSFGQKHRDHGPIQVLPLFLFSFFNRVFLLNEWRENYDEFQVHRKLASSVSKGDPDLYETELLEQFADVESAAEFFTCLDHQLNKVNQFYRSKEKEFVEKGNSAKQQLDFLVQAKNKLKWKKEASSQDSYDDPSISSQLSSGMHPIPK